MHPKRVGILRGGAGENYESSLQRGGDIISYISDNLSDKYKPVDILVDKEGVWYLGGLPVKPAELVSKIDIVWNLSHPSFSNILESFYIPNIGFPAFSAFFGNSREMLREHMNKVGAKMPRHIVLPAYREDFSAQGGSASGGDGEKEKYAVKKAREVFEKFSSPWIVKCFTPGADTDEYVARTFPELIEAIDTSSKSGESILVQEFIAGRGACVHSMAGFRGEKVYIFPLWDLSDNFSSGEKEIINNLVKDLHSHIGTTSYLKSDFVINKRGKVYILDFELAPDVKPDSHFSQACEYVGAQMYHVVEHILEAAI
jgi:D-alanine-D-alanine ligase-like ATP-grasp enzyme